MWKKRTLLGMVLALTMFVAMTSRATAKEAVIGSMLFLCNKQKKTRPSPKTPIPPKIARKIHRVERNVLVR